MNMTVPKAITPRKAKKIFFIDYKDEMLTNRDLIEEMKSNIHNNYGYIIKNVIDSVLIDKIVTYLKSVASCSLPAWYPLVDGCPDFHRINNLDERSYVKAIMHQFNFHPWNQNVFNLFQEMQKIYLLKNQLSNLEANAFLNNTPKDGHIARLAFQFYPKGGGNIKMHADPVGAHQVSVPILMMSKKGQDYASGGGFVMNENNEIVDIDSLMDKGDVLFFNAEVIHGVKPIDPGEKINWLQFQGRWIMIASIIKTQPNVEALNALQLED